MKPFGNPVSEGLKPFGNALKRFVALENVANNNYFYYYGSNTLLNPPLKMLGEKMFS